LLLFLKDKEIIMNNVLRNNLILDVDSYKFGHSKLYPPGTTGMFAYIESRSSDTTIVPFGLQMWIKKTLLTPITESDVNEAIDFCAARGEPFDRTPWDHIITTYGGYLPITIRAIPEGTKTKSLTPLVTIECTDPVVFFIVSYFETTIQRGVWYPTTIASRDFKNYTLLKSFYDKGSDKPFMLPFALHDFAGRGVSSEETAQIGGAAHMVYFQGSDTVSGVRAANKYYNIPMSGFSVVATEHSVQCAYGPENQEDYIRTVLNTYAKPGAIISLVLDGYDIFREATLLGTVFKQQIIDTDTKVVYRPDSGNPMDIIPQLLKMQEQHFGITINSKGYKQINNVGIIWGDGINFESMSQVSSLVDSLGYAPESVIYGSGGALLQKVDRDVYKFAQKTSALLINGVWVDTYKDPVTDPGKKSKAGRVNTPAMQLIYKDGQLLVDDSLDVVRSRAFANI
jgi:nicotinamide phosphoribosyltransferase